MEVMKSFKIYSRKIVAIHNMLWSGLEIGSENVETNRYSIFCKKSKRNFDIDTPP